VPLEKKVPIGEKTFAKQIVTALMCPLQIYGVARGSICRKVPRNSEGYFLNLNALVSIYGKRLRAPRTIASIDRLVCFMDSTEPLSGLF
jgi:hypothetical protein